MTHQETAPRGEQARRITTSAWRGHSRALEGLSVGDAFGERFFGPPERWMSWIQAREVGAPEPWRWTDDTVMALACVEFLEEHGAIDPGALARAFAARYVQREPWRGVYGGGAHRLLHQFGLLLDLLGVLERIGATSGSLLSPGTAVVMRCAPRCGSMPPMTSVCPLRTSAMLSLIRSDLIAHALRAPRGDTTRWA